MEYQLHFSYNGETITSIFPNDESFLQEQIMGENAVTLYFSTDDFVDFPLGATCQIFNQTYTMWVAPKIVKRSSHHFDYTMELHPPQYLLKRLKFKNTNDHSLSFPLTASPEVHLRMLVDNLNAFEGGDEWSVGNFSEVDEKLISYHFASCHDALNQMAETFKTEWQIIGKEISLTQVQHNADSPLPLSYGRGNGFISGVTKTGQSQAITRLYVQGGERNIDFSTYGSKTLLLPKNHEFQHNGQAYRTDEKGHFLEVVGTNNAHFEAHLDLSDIYPKRVGEVTQTRQDRNIFYFSDETISEALNYSTYQIKGEKLSVYFESGMLSGREFDANYNHQRREFQLIPKEEDGTTMPNDIFAPQQGDKYAVFGMMMPLEYINDPNTRSGGSFELLQKATQHLHAHKQGQFSFRGELDGVWAKQNWENIGGRIVLGGMILFSDMQFHPTPEPIRIVGIKKFLNDPHRPVIELSNDPIPAQGQGNIFKRIENQKQTIHKAQKQQTDFIKRRFSDSQQTAEKLKEHFSNYENSVNPLAVQTMQLLVGDPALQFRFVEMSALPQIVDVPLRMEFNEQTKQFKVYSALLLHQSLGIGTIKPNRNGDEYLSWLMNDFVSGDLTEKETSYFLYAKVEKGRERGEFLLSSVKKELEEDEDFYYLLVGILNPEHQGTRSFAKLYGFVEILPGQITANRLTSTDGKHSIELGSDKIKVVGEVEMRNNSVTAGRLFVGNDKTEANAGIFGDKNGAEAVRFASGFDREHHPNDLDEAVKNAKFRVLEDGTLISKKANVSGHIEAESGQIGHFSIDGKGIVSKFFPSSDLYGIRIDASGIDFKMPNRQVLLGQAFSASSGMVGMARIQNDNDYGIGLYISVGTPSDRLHKSGGVGEYIYCGARDGSALYLDAPQGKAIDIKRGDVCLEREVNGRVVEDKGYSGTIWIYNRKLRFERGIMVEVVQ